MKVEIYTDDGYVESGICNIELNINIGELVEMLYQKKILSESDVNSILPSGCQVVSPITNGE